MLFLDRIESTLNEAKEYAWEFCFDHMKIDPGGDIVINIKNYPSKLMKFGRKYLPCPDGMYRESSRAVQEYLMFLGLITSNSSDTCSNIPYKFFKNSHNYKTSPYDKRVKCVMDFCKRKGVDPFFAFKDWTGTGAPDLSDFISDEYIQCYEVKMLGDSTSRKQLFTHNLFRQIGIDVNLVEIIEDRDKVVYKRERLDANRNSRRLYESFWKTSLGLKLDNFIISIMQSERGELSRDNPYFWKVTSRRSNGGDLLHYRKRPSSLINTLALCVANTEKYDYFFESEEIYRVAELVFTGGRTGGNLKWWLVPFLLTPWLKHKKIDRNLSQLLDISYRWEDFFKTNHMTVPGFRYFEKNIGFKSDSLQMKFGCNDFNKLFELCKSSNKGMAFNKLKEFLLDIHRPSSQWDFP